MQVRGAVGHDARAEAKTETKEPKRTRGFGDDLDPTGQGILQSYERYCNILQKRYPGLGPKAVIKKLLGEDVKFDWDDEGDSSTTHRKENVTGNVGGKILVCYLIRVEMEWDHIEAAGGIAEWLQEQLPKCALFPAAKLCLEKAIKYLPKYEASLAAARKAAAGPSTAKAPKLFDDSDSD